MPYKDKEKQKEAVRKAVDKHRKGITEQGITEQGITEDGAYFKDGVEMVPASYVQGLNGKRYEVLPERPRYVTLSDGQVLDRANQSEGHTSGDRVVRMQAANEAAYNFIPRKNPKGLAKAKELITS